MFYRIPDLNATVLISRNDPDAVELDAVDDSRVLCKGSESIAAYQVPNNQAMVSRASHNPLHLNQLFFVF
jgi:hypothetical protein